MLHGILYYIRHPLNVGFFGALKSNWRKAADSFKIAHFGLSVTNRTFVQVFKIVRTNSCKMSTIVSSFAKAGIYPVNRDAIGKGGTLGPVKLYENSSTLESDLSSIDAYLPPKVMEAVMDPSTVQKYNQQYNKGYISSDELYTVWKRLKKL